MVTPNFLALFISLPKSFTDAKLSLYHLFIVEVLAFYYLVFYSSLFPFDNWYVSTFSNQKPTAIIAYNVTNNDPSNQFDLEFDTQDDTIKTDKAKRNVSKWGKLSVKGLSANHPTTTTNGVTKMEI